MKVSTLILTDTLRRTAKLVHHPLQASLSQPRVSEIHTQVFESTHQSSDHDNSNRQAIPQALEANVLIDPTHGRSESLARLPIRIQLADHNIGGVRYNRAQDTGQITAGEGDRCLRSFVVIRLLPREVVVDHLNDRLERCELHHRVRDLSTPEWIQTLEESA